MSIFESNSTAAAPSQEQVPTSSLPHVWVGFVFVVVFFAAEIFEVVSAGFDESAIPAVSFKLILVALAGWVYWLFCVHRFHKVLDEASGGSYPVSTTSAVVGHIVPFYNFYWLFKWPSELASYIESRGRDVQIVSGYLIGGLLLISVLIGRLFDGAIGLAGVFGVGLYVNSKLRQYVQSLKIASMHTAPPLPDERFFRPQEPQAATTPAATGGDIRDQIKLPPSLER